MVRCSRVFLDFSFCPIFLSQFWVGETSDFYITKRFTGCQQNPPKNSMHLIETREGDELKLNCS